MKMLLFLLGFLFTVPALAQSDALGSVQTRADTWQQVVLQEVTFVHTDKSFYLAGEVLWCRLYCVDAISHRPSGVSKLAYVELLDQDNKPVLQGKIALVKGLGEGSFYIPPSVPTGSYLLRAYTSWMKNFGPESFFTQPLTIANTVNGVDSAALTRPDTTVNHYSLTFFPEGGDLIAGLPSNLAFEAVDDQGRGLDAEGFILSGNNDTILTFRPQQDGMGVVDFKPTTGQVYHAVLLCPDGRSRTWPLPPVLASGYTLHLRDDGASVNLAVHSSSGLQLQDTRLFVHSGNRSAFTGQPPAVTGDSAFFTIDRNSLQEGNSRFTLFDATGRPRAERLYFIAPHNKLNIDATTDKPEYNTRQRVRINIAVTGYPTGPAVADTPATHLSVAVYRLDSLQGYPPTDILRYLWTSSEWIGRIPATNIFNNPSLAGLYSLTHGWTRFRWPDVLSHPSGPRIYPPEIRGQLITGHLTDPHTGAPEKETTAWLSSPGLIYQFAATQTDSNGKFQFDIKDFFGSDGIVIHTEKDAKVSISTPFSEQYPTAHLSPFRLSPSQLRLLTRHSIGMQVQNVFSGDSLKHYALPSIDTTPFYSRGDYTYNLDNYTRFTTVEEVLREYVREINVTRPHGKLHLVMLNEPFHTVFNDGNTLVLLDGVPVTNDRIFAYDALKIKRLDVIPREYILGPSHFSGIASFITYKGDYEGLELDSSSLQIEYEGMQYNRQFYAPAYNTIQQTNGRLPDFRNVLYWSPDLRAGIKPTPVEFFTSDIPGDYLVVIQGLSTDGRAGVSLSRFTVRPGPAASR
jgi:hypothetical protein